MRGDSFMGRTKRWTYSEYQDGMQYVTLSSWKYFADFINKEFLDYRTYIYRGVTNYKWHLRSSLDRLLQNPSLERARQIHSRHLSNFKRAALGRRGPNPIPLNSDSDWWALGQHNGLATPLLDWTESPFVALYFAFLDERLDRAVYRAVYAPWEPGIGTKAARVLLDYEEQLAKWKIDNPSPLERISFGLDKQKSSTVKGPFTGKPAPSKPDVPEVIRPLSEDNPRLQSQRALFVKCPVGASLEDWIRENFKGEEKYVVLFQIRIPSKDREVCLRSLNRMNINHLSLFPDLSGASVFSNTDLKIRNY